MPGGKWDETDKCVEDTAVSVLSFHNVNMLLNDIPQRREAFEEVGIHSIQDGSMLSHYDFASKDWPSNGQATGASALCTGTVHSRRKPDSDTVSLSRLSSTDTDS